MSYAYLDLGAALSQSRGRGHREGARRPIFRRPEKAIRQSFSSESSHSRTGKSGLTPLNRHRRTSCPRAPGPAAGVVRAFSAPWRLLGTSVIAFRMVLSRFGPNVISAGFRVPGSGREQHGLVNSTLVYKNIHFSRYLNMTFVSDRFMLYIKFCGTFMY